MTTDRLFVGMALGTATGCKSPHFVADVLLTLREHGHDARLISSGPEQSTFSIGGRALWFTPSPDASSPEWSSIVFADKCVRFKACFTKRVPTGFIDGNAAFDLTSFVLRRYANGGKPPTLNEAYQHIVKDGTFFHSWTYKDVTYAEPLTFLNAFETLLLVPAS